MNIREFEESVYLGRFCKGQTVSIEGVIQYLKDGTMSCGSFRGKTFRIKRIKGNSLILSGPSRIPYELAVWGEALDHVVILRGGDDGKSKSPNSQSSAKNPRRN